MSEKTSQDAPPKTTVSLRGDFIPEAQRIAKTEHNGNLSGYVKALIERDIAARTSAGTPVIEQLAAQYAPWHTDAIRQIFSGTNQARFLAMLLDELPYFACDLAEHCGQLGPSTLGPETYAAANAAIRARSEDAEPCLTSTKGQNMLTGAADDLNTLLERVFIKGHKIEDFISVSTEEHEEYGKFICDYDLKPEHEIKPLPWSKVKHLHEAWDKEKADKFNRFGS